MTIKSPCKNCENRCVGCHSNCDKYIEYRKQLDNRNEIIKTEKGKTTDLDRYEINKHKKLKKITNN